MSCCSSDDRSSLKSSTAHLCQKWAEMSWSQKLSTFTIKTGCVRFSRLARGNIKCDHQRNFNQLSAESSLSPSQSGKHAVAFRSAGSEPCLETLSADCFKESNRRKIRGRIVPCPQDIKGYPIMWLGNSQKLV